MCGEFNKFPDFFEQAFKIFVDSKIHYFINGTSSDLMDLLYP